MEKSKEILIKLNSCKYIISIIFIIMGVFYWFQVRPTHIRIKCEKYVHTLYRMPEDPQLIEVVLSNRGEAYNYSYNSCLRSNGIDK